jgi:hypothetical protein
MLFTFINALELSNFYTFKLYAYIIVTFFIWRDHPLVDQGLIVETSRPHSDTTRSVGLLWTSVSPAQRSLLDNTQHSQETDIHASGEVRSRIASK